MSSMVWMDLKNHFELDVKFVSKNSVTYSKKRIKMYLLQFKIINTEQNSSTKKKCGYVNFIENKCLTD